MSFNPFPNHWKIMPLAEAVDALIDYRGKTPKKAGDGIPLVTAKIVKGGTLLPATEYIAGADYESWMVRGFPETGDVVVTTEAPLGEVAQLTDANVALAQRIVTLRGAKGVLLNDYLRYVMQGGYIQSQLESRASGSTVKGIKQSELRKVLLPIPPLQEQGFIASVLKSIDDKIQLNPQINQTLEQMAQALFKSWFVDFEPVKAKIAARERWQALQQDNEPTSPVCYAAELEEQPAVGDLNMYMNLAAMQAISGKTAEQLDALGAKDPERYNELYETAALFPSAMQESELGQIPEGWEVLPFQSCLSKTIGGDWGKDEPDEKHTEKVRIIRGTDLPRIYSGNDSSAPERYVEAKKLKSRRLIDGDIVIEISGGSKGQPTGRSLFMAKAVIDRLGVCEPASFCRLFRPLNESLGLLLSLHLQKIYAEGKTWLYQNQSTGISNFQTKVFLEKELIVVPAPIVQESFYKRVIPLLNQLHSDENSALSALRDTLLPKLLSGELTIPSVAEAQAEQKEAAHV